MLVGGGFWPNPFDMYLLRFREGQGIPPHVDAVESGEHYRLNIIIKAARSGGEFVCTNPIFESPRIKYFRSDISEHTVTQVLKGKTPQAGQLLNSADTVDIENIFLIMR